MPITESVPVREAPIVEASPVVQKPVVQKVALRKRVRKTRKKVSGTAAKKAARPVAKTALPPKPAPAKSAAVTRITGYERLVGAYVQLQLASGNEVKGILKEITATDYKVELPGLGDFPYLHSKVKNIQLAQ